jgi:hypothetical protein
MAEPNTLNQPTKIPVILDRIVSFAILLASWLVIDRLFDCVFSSWHRTFLHGAIEGSIWAALVMFVPPFSMIFSRLVGKYVWKRK